jgi:hypothetical protein
MIHYSTELLRLFAGPNLPDKRTRGGIYPTYVTLDEARVGVREVCSMARGVPLTDLAEMLERVAGDLRDAAAELDR